MVPLVVIQDRGGGEPLPLQFKPQSAGIQANVETLAIAPDKRTHRDHRWLGISLDDLLNALTAEPELLTDILLYHVVSGKIPAADVVGLNGTKVETLSGESWTVIVDGETVSIEDGYGEIAKVIDVDVKASNGVIHVVDSVIQGGVPGE